MERTIARTVALFLVTLFAAGAAAADKVVVFGLEPVNVEPGVARAATVAIVAELQSRGYDAIDGHDLLHAAPPAPVAPPPVAPAPEPDAGPEPAVEAPAPAAADVAAAPIPPAPATAVEIAKRLGCSHYVEGSIVRLGRRMRLSLTMHGADGPVVSTDRMDARGEEDLAVAIPRLVEALVTPKTPDETRDLDNATVAETQTLPNRFRLERNLGILLGMGIGALEKVDSYALINFDARLEFGDLLVEINVGPGFNGMDESDPDGFKAHILVDLGAAYYLIHGGVSPYIGAGVGIFLGDRLETCEPEVGLYEDGYEEEECEGGDSAIGWEVYPVVGLELLRQSSIRVHVDLRYAFMWEGTIFGHAPVVIAGINF